MRNNYLKGAWRGGLRSFLCLAMLFCAAILSFAERLPIKIYTMADGLAHDDVLQIVPDSRGFLWFCTSEGLSRFDGYRFTNYSVDQGLPGRAVYRLLETRDGQYWVATNNGLARFDPAAVAKPRFVMDYRGAETRGVAILRLMEDRAGALWAGGEKGLFRLTQTQGQWVCERVELNGPVTGSGRYFSVRSLVEDRRGALWICATDGLYRRWPDGRLERFAEAEGLNAADLVELFIDRAGQIWLGTRHGLRQLVAEPALKTKITARVYTTRDGLSGDYIQSIFQTSDGRLWVVMLGAVGVNVASTGAGDLRFRSFGQANGLNTVGRLAEDRDGNLWVSSEEGALKVARNGFTTFDELDGLTGSRVGSLLINQSGELCVFGGGRSGVFLHRFNGRGFDAIELKLPRGISFWSWGWYQMMFQARAGEWWLPTFQGVARYPLLERLDQLTQARPNAVYTERDGLGSAEVFRLFEDSHGDVWISGFSEAGNTLTRWERRTGRIERFPPVDRRRITNTPTAFCEDAAGNLWIGYYSGGLARYAAGRFTFFSTTEGLPAGFIRALYLDSARRLWIATSESGAARIDDTSAERPRFIQYNTANGLASNQATCFTEDQAGRIYIGTGRGVNRLNPVTGQIKHFTVADGLVSNFINVALRDRSGALWFGALDGISRLIPQPERPSQPPPVMLSELRIGGQPYPLSALGAASVEGLRLDPGQNELRFNFFGLSFEPGETLSYQYRLEGADHDWSEPSNQREVNYANLAPGAYRFLARAVTSDGVVSAAPASAQFEILPPLWRRWWTLLSAALLLVAGFVAFDRYRVARLRQLNAALTASQQSETRFRTLAETASDAIITIDGSGVIVFVNPATEKIFGYTATELIGQGLTMLMPEYMRTLHSAGLARYQQTGKRRIHWETLELPGLHRDGHEFPLEISFGEFAYEERRYFTGIARDITERKRAEEALRKAREERLRELERVRRRIATDLHDDIGSSLTQISILSEVLRQQLDGSQAAAEPLDMIAGASRELVDAMSDIVWAINPQKDHLSDLTRRMRRFASDSLTARNIRFQLSLPETDSDLALGANLRREVFLIFKESVNNMVKHSGCSEARIELSFAEGYLTLRLSDNGRGFDTTRESEGHGLVSMRDRARGIGGALDLYSQTGQGATVTLRAPLEQN